MTPSGPIIAQVCGAPIVDPFFSTGPQSCAGMKHSGYMLSPHTGER